jgi:hypothetical protein
MLKARKSAQHDDAPLMTAGDDYAGRIRESLLLDADLSENRLPGRLVVIHASMTGYIGSAEVTGTMFALRPRVFF